MCPVAEIRAITVCLAIVDNDLRNARLKTAASSLPNRQESKHVNEGRRGAENGEFSMPLPPTPAEFP